MTRLDETTLFAVYFVVMIVFALCMGAIGLILRSPRAVYWLASDVTAMLGLLLLASEVNTEYGLRSAGTLFCVLATFLLRFSGVVSRETRRRLWWPGWAFCGFFAVAALTLSQTGAPNLRLIVSVTGLTLACFAIPLAILLENNFRPKLGASWLSAVFTLTGIEFLVLSLLYFAAPTGQFRLYGDALPKVITLSTSLFIAVAGHIGFILFMMEDLTQRKTQIALEQASAEKHREFLEQRAEELKALAEERRNLLEILTHEVRQPLNNASAALQNMMGEIRGRSEFNLLSGPLDRAQGVIDEVTLALSNALIGSSLIERRSNFSPVSCSAFDIAVLARLDCDRREQHRIRLREPGGPIFVESDPVLLRIALRNLLDNAVRYAPPDSSIFLDLLEDEERFGTEMVVSNEETGEPWPKDVDIFVPRVRGNSSRHAGGMGLGLYIVSEVAKLHHGSVKTFHRDGRRYFSLFFPS